MTERSVISQPPIKWTAGWPTEPGKYWFYGYRYGRVSMGIAREPTLILVGARFDGNGNILVSSERDFMFEGETEEAHFAPFVSPPLPTLKEE